MKGGWEIERQKVGKQKVGRQKVGRWEVGGQKVKKRIEGFKGKVEGPRKSEKDYIVYK